MRIKINGEWINVKDGDELETGKEGADKDGEEGEESSEKSMLEQAKKIGTEIAKNAMAELNLGDTSKITKKLDRMVNHFYGDDSKLMKILHGKDLYGGDELTKEEKIIGFYHALVTNNNLALKALSEGVSADGGYLFPHEFFNEVVRDLPNLNVMRQYVRIIPMKRNAMDITSLVEHPKVYWTAENAAKTTTTARFAQTTLTAYKAAAIIYSSDELIDDSTEFDLVQLIIQLFSEAIADEEDYVIQQGNGTTQPQGLSQATITTLNGTGVAYVDLTALFYGLPAKYRPNAVWVMNSLTLSSIESTRDTQGRPIFNQATDSLPSTLKGKPIVISENCPGRTIYFGDLKRAYFLGDRKRMSAKISNDTETAFTKDQTAIRVVFRIGGKVVLANAIRKTTNF